MLVRGDAQRARPHGDVRALPCSDHLKEIVYRCIGERRKRYESADELVDGAAHAARPLQRRRAAQPQGRAPGVHRHPRPPRAATPRAPPSAPARSSTAALGADDRGRARPAERAAGGGPRRRAEADGDQAAARERPPDHAAQRGAVLELAGGGRVAQAWTPRQTETGSAECLLRLPGGGTPATGLLAAGAAEPGRSNVCSVLHRNPERVERVVVGHQVDLAAPADRPHAGERRDRAAAGPQRLAGRAVERVENGRRRALRALRAVELAGCRGIRRSTAAKTMPLTTIGASGDVEVARRPAGSSASLPPWSTSLKATTLPVSDGTVRRRTSRPPARAPAASRGSSGCRRLPTSRAPSGAGRR